MSTGTYIVTSALQTIGAHTVMKPANPVSLENGRNILNSYIASLQDIGIDTGAVPIEALGDELSEPLGITNDIVNCLAKLLVPHNPGAQISPDLRINANRSESAIKTTYQVIEIPTPKTRDTLPRGAGNFRRRGRIFFRKGEEIG
jgi:hypothetical protein